MNTVRNPVAYKVKEWLKDHHLIVDHAMYWAIVHSISFRKNGESVATANALAFAMELIDKNRKYFINRAKYEQLVSISAKVWKSMK